MNIIQEMKIKQRFVLFIVHFYYTFHASLKEVFKLTIFNVSGKIYYKIKMRNHAH